KSWFVDPRLSSRGAALEDVDEPCGKSVDRRRDQVGVSAFIVQQLLPTAAGAGNERDSLAKALEPCARAIVLGARHPGEPSVTPQVAQGLLLIEIDEQSDRERPTGGVGQQRFVRRPPIFHRRLAQERHLLSDELVFHAIKRTAEHPETLSALQTPEEHD